MDAALRPLKTHMRGDGRICDVDDCEHKRELRALTADRVWLP